MADLQTVPVSALSGVGKKVAEKLENLSIVSVQDLLFHLPHRYEDRTRVYPIAHLQPGSHVTVVADVLTADIKFGRKRMLVVKVADNSGTLTLRFFHFNAAQKNILAVGNKVRCFGEVRRGPNGPEMTHPEFKLVKDDDPQVVEASLTPVYPTTDGLKQISLRNLADQALSLLQQADIEDLLPEGMYDQQMRLKDAISLIHRPPPDISVDTLLEGQHPAQVRLILEELTAHNLSMQHSRHQSQAHQAKPLIENGSLSKPFLEGLPFKPTGAQARVVEEIKTDLKQAFPMMRLVQGDVGSGKTLVAVLAALVAIENGQQVALMAPTEILAEQHANNLSQWLEPLSVSVGWLSGKLGAKARQQSLGQIASGQCQLVVGTHALFQEQVVFNSLSLVIIDEQHRFGVHQRLALRQKGEQQGYYPHQLIMTATPIPRTLAMTAYADLDTSIIDELPPGRTPVTTVAMSDHRRDEIVERVRHVCEQEKKQAYWVCTLIEESEVLECQAAEDTKEALAAALTGLEVGLVHGRMKPAEKQQVMERFKQGHIDLLVATTVIEVGVDVPNASLMIIENPERLGLAQLHQLRGRVGRGALASHCVLLYHHPLSKTAQQRLGVMRDTTDGFVIAQKDLEIRGPGEFLGTKQTGLANLRIADLSRDSHLIPQVQRLATHIWQQYPVLAQKLLNRWLPGREEYSNA